MGMQIHGCQLLVGDFHLGGIEVGVEVCLYSQPRLSCRCPDEIDNDLVAHQGAAPPIHGDVREQAMLDLVPFRRRSKITSAITRSTVRQDGVVPLGQHPTALEPYPCPFFGTDFALLRIFPGVQAGLAVESLLRACPSDVLEDHFVARQRLSFPVVADQAEHPVVDRVPLARPRWVVRHRDHQVELVCQVLQRQLPLPLAVVVGPATVRLDQQPRRARVASASALQPPLPDTGHGKGRRVVRGTYYDQSIVVLHIIDAVGDSSALRPAWKIMCEHLVGLSPPRPAWVLERSDQLLLLAVDANHGPAMSYVIATQAVQIAELPVAVWVADLRQGLAVGAQREVHPPQQACDRVGRELEAVATQGLGEVSDRAIGPLQSRHGIASGRILEQRFQGPQDPGNLTSAFLRPAPGWRTRPGVRSSPRRNSRRPRAMVLRSSPVMRWSKAIPPRPCWWARKPTNNRRHSSSAFATRQLMDRCSWAVGPCGWHKQSGHSQQYGRQFRFASFRMDADLLPRATQQLGSQRHCTSIC